MTAYIALIRAVNVGGTGKLPMTALAEFCRKAGFLNPRTYLASGNVIFQSKVPEDQIRIALETQLAAYAGKPVGVLVRSAAEMADTAARNPFAGENFSRVMALFTDDPLPLNPLEGASGIKDEIIQLGKRALFIFYPTGQADTKLRLPAMKSGTARNMNTVRKLAEMAQDFTA
jgi:uncharacterized protein (DUF1697 family)